MKSKPRLLLLFVVASIALIVIASQALAATRRAEVLRTVAKSTVVVSVDLGHDAGATGSGTVIGRYSHFSWILTCHHVIEGAKSIKVSKTFHSDDPEITALVELDDPHADLALLVADLQLPALPVAAVEPELYDTVYAFGAPLGEDGTATEGLITDLRYQMGHQLWYRVTGAYVAPGISGGTATNDRGELIGVPARASKAIFIQGLLIPLPAVAQFIHGYTTNVH